MRASKPLCLAARLVLAGVLLALISGAAAQPPLPEPPTVDGEDRLAIVDQVLAALAQVYVFPEVADRMAEHVRTRLAAGAYDGLRRLPELTETLTDDLRAVSGDLHLRVMWTPPSSGAGPPDEEAERARGAERMRRASYCFETVQNLPGNVGYLELGCFAPAELAGARRRRRCASSPEATP